MFDLLIDVLIHLTNVVESDCINNIFFIMIKYTFLDVLLMCRYCDNVELKAKILFVLKLILCDTFDSNQLR
jgi:hypothetical protein